MKGEDTRDQATERLLQRSMQRDGDAARSPDCLDAETCAAWADGTLDRSALALVETHVAGCARCQSMAAAMMRSAPAPAEVRPWWQRFRSAWLVPVTAGAAAVALWAIVPDETSVPAQPTASVIAPAQPSVTEPKAPAQPALVDRLETRADTQVTATGNRQAAAEGRQMADERRKEASALKRQSEGERFGAAAADAAARAAPSAGPAPSVAAAPARSASAASSAQPREAAGALMTQEAFAPREVASPDPAVRWRLGAAGLVERTEDGGKTWIRLPTGVAVDLIAGASPSPEICWVVGRNGTVLRSIDGRNWARATSPEAADLVAVEASDASTAVVTTSDGRRFRTINGGQSWSREPLQDFQPTTF